MAIPTHTTDGRLLCTACDAPIDGVPAYEGELGKWDHTLPVCADVDACFDRIQARARVELAAECEARGLPVPTFDRA